MTLQLSKIQESVQLIKQAEEQYKLALNEAVSPGLNYIAETYGSQIGLINIFGYTPGFNDGEPCTHSSDWGVGYSDLDNYGHIDLVEEWYGEEKAEELLDNEKTIDIPNEVRVFVQEVLIPFYENKLDTDFRVHILFEDGTYRAIEDEYDCGY